MAPTFQSLLKDKDSDNIEFLQRNIQGIDVENNLVYLTSTSTSTGTSTESTTTECIPYKSLVVATGSSINLSSIPGASRYALPFYTVQDCYELKKQLNVLDVYISKLLQDKYSDSDNGSDKEKKKEEEVSIVIVGGGYGGVELALNLRQRLSMYETKDSTMSTRTRTRSSRDVEIKITMIHRGQEVLQYANEYNRKNGQERLKSANVDICTNTNVVEILPPMSSQASTSSTSSSSSSSKEQAALKYRCQIVTSSKTTDSETDTDSDTDTKPTVPATTTFDADLLLWTAGATSKNEPQNVLNSILPRDAKGKIITNKYLHVNTMPNVYALGDCARCRKVPYAATAAVAMQQAPVVAWNVFASTLNDMNIGENDNGNHQQQLQQQQLQQQKKYELLPFDYLDLGQMMTLGSDDATISSPTGLFELEGSLASVARRLIYAVRMPTLQQALTAALSSTNKRLEKGSLNKVKKVIDWK